MQENKNKSQNVPINSAGETTETFYISAKPESKPTQNDQTIKHQTSSTKKESVISSSKLIRKIINFAEWIIVSTAIFAILFLVMNFQSYSQLFISKWQQITGQTEEIVPDSFDPTNSKNSAPENQLALPVVQTVDQAKKQIPELKMTIAPPDTRIVIERIGKSVPVVQIPVDKLLQKDWAGLEAQAQDALKYGVLHFPGTALPGENGNVVITGHSSYFPWDPGRFKDVFALLHQIEIGDTIVVYKDQLVYKYLVYDKFVVNPSQVEVLTQEGENRLTLITCTPVGTALNRLIVEAKPIK